MMYDLALTDAPEGVVMIAPRSRDVAARMQRAGFATVLFDLLEEDEGDHRFDIRLLADRMLAARDWLRDQPAVAHLPVAYFGAGTGAAAALVAAARDPHGVSAIVSRGGRPDLAGPALPAVRAPTLLIVGGGDLAELGLNRAALARLGAPGRLELVEDTLIHVATLAADWFRRYLSIGTAASLQP
jgi:putative phosphoribosyl transferase